MIFDKGLGLLLSEEDVVVTCSVTGVCIWAVGVADGVVCCDGNLSIPSPHEELVSVSS